MRRRRFLTIAAGCATLAAWPLHAAPLRQWRGVALGADATIVLTHPRAEALIDMALSEISRLEAIFSLHRPDSELSQLNAEARLAAPSLDLVECLGLCDQAHRATEGLFDPSVQPLWDCHARAAAAGGRATTTQISDALSRSGWSGVHVDSAEIRLRPGMALTLNGIAQGFIADRVTALLRRHGVENVLVDTGEIVATGGADGADAWPVQIRDGRQIALRNRALATSAPLGTVLDADGTVGHIIDPRSGQTVPPRWRQVSVSAHSAAVADALSTAACLLPDQGAIGVACAAMGDARLEQALPGQVQPG